MAYIFSLCLVKSETFLPLPGMETKFLRRQLLFFSKWDIEDSPKGWETKPMFSTYIGDLPKLLELDSPQLRCGVVSLYTTNITQNEKAIADPHMD